MIPVMLFPLLEAPINKVLQMDPAVPARLQDLEGSLLQLHIKPFPQPLRMTVCAGRLQFSASEAQPDVMLSGELQAFIQAQMNKGDIPAGALQISGDIASAQKWQKLFADLQPDWEEQLSVYVGDIAAHEIGKFFRALQLWAQSSLTHTASSVAQYVQEEANWVVSGDELQVFNNAVDTLRDDAERLLARARQKGVL